MSVMRETSHSDIGPHLFSSYHFTAIRRLSTDVNENGVTPACHAFHSQPTQSCSL